MVMEKSYPCKDNLWGKCGALGDALRRASEAERKVEVLEEKVKNQKERIRILEGPINHAGGLCRGVEQGY
jgi:hypothetical protein